MVDADGGAIVLSNQLACSGARLLFDLLGRLERGAAGGLATLCVGVGQGVSMLIHWV